MTGQLDRRAFLRGGAAAGLAWGVAGTALGQASASAPDKLAVAIMGLNGRGLDLARSFAARSDVVIAHLCDVDQRALDRAQAALASVVARPPQSATDVRRVLDDPGLAILVVATPNHWHAPATILACQAGKHVYVEKPCSHTPQEGEWSVAAARRHQRVVTMGTQRRSRPAIREAIARLRAGVIGNLLYARTWYRALRPTIGRGQQTDPPPWLAYELWQGPAPRRPYKDNLIHYNWHWHWHWGNGELGNNGVHALDVARWGMGVDYPTRVISAGGRYRFDDDQETPDTHLVAYEFGKKSISWEGVSWSPTGPDGSQFGVTFHGTEGTMHVLDSGFRILDLANKPVAAVQGNGGEAEHVANFLEAIRQEQRPHADIEEAHKSTLLCHLGNIAHRVGRSLTTRPTDGHILGDAEAAAMWSKEYEPEFEPHVS